MFLHRRPALAQALSCWNWKCALLSATARSLVYVTAMARSAPHGRFAVVLVEITYVMLTAGIYAGVQRRALALRPRLLGNLIVVLCVPGLAQVLDWLTYRALGAVPTERATLAVCIFAAISALFHLRVMRNGAFLSGRGCSLLEDFQRMPRLIVGFVVRPFVFFVALTSRAAVATESEGSL